MALTKFPGLIDIHVHLREPGATHKEDFYTGSRAAVKGGFTYILDMPNNPIPTFSPQALNDKIRLSQKARCDIGFHYGSNGKNTDTFPEISKHSKVFGLKLYCNHTTGNYLIEDSEVLEKIFATWRSEKPILVHAQGEKLAFVIELARKYSQKVHVCHISLLEEVEMVRKAKRRKQPLSAGVTPHHLFLVSQDTENLRGFAIMKPPLSSQQDQDALWDGLIDGTIDVVETDHSPHTREEKQRENPLFGVPGLESALGLLLKAVHEGKITIENVLNWLYTNPKALFNIPEQVNTFIEFDQDMPFILNEKEYETKCGWSPFTGWELYGKVISVTFKGRLVVDNGVVI